MTKLGVIHNTFKLPKKTNNPKIKVNAIQI